MFLRRLPLTLLLLGGLISASAQVHLRVTSLSRFPVAPVDTAFESFTYDSIQVTVENIGSTVLNNDNILLFIMGNPANGYDTMYDSPNALFTIQPGTTANITVDSYSFKPVHFDDGDNIVVVWPQARSTPSVSDTLSFHVYFISLLAEIENPANREVIISPNPVSDYILLDIPEKMSLKQVRIIDILGNCVYNLSSGQNYISTSEWVSGIYFIEMTGSNGSQTTKKLLKN